MATTELATLADVPALADIFFSGFNDEFFAPIFPQTAEGRAFVEESYAAFVAGSKAQKPTVYVVRDETGKALSSCLFWIVSPEDKGLRSWRERWSAAKPGMSDAALEEFFSGMETQHKQAMRETEHIYLEVIATHESARKRGHATALLQLGNQLADDLDYALYLDAEKDAKSLYLRVGYEELIEVSKTSPLAPLKRPRKSERRN